MMEGSLLTRIFIPFLTSFMPSVAMGYSLGPPARAAKMSGSGKPRSATWGRAGTALIEGDMIPAAPLPMKQAAPRRWQALWREAVRDPRELLSMLGLEALAAGLPDAAAMPAPNGNFPLRVPRGFVARMRHGDPADPLLRQVLPVLDEDRIVPGFGLDAVGDEAARRGGGVIHKYDGRALLVATGSCAVHCRYCFRRHYPYADDTAASAG